MLPHLALALICLRAAAGSVGAADARLQSGNRTQGISLGWGHSWTPGFGKTRTDIAFWSFHPHMGWLVTDRLELGGEGTLFGYSHPEPAVAGGIVGIAGRYHFWNDRTWIPYLTAGAGLLWTSQKVRELDRTFNFQLTLGAGLRQVRARGPGWMVELRNHHISNANTAGANLGINAAEVLVGIQWVLRR